MTKTFFTCAACAGRRTLFSVNRDGFPLLRARNPSLTVSRTFATAAIKPDAPRQLDTALEDAKPTISKKKEASKRERNIRESLQYLGDDPFLIAQHVDTILQKDRFEEAYALTQKASLNKQLPVAWNHLIGYLLENQQLKMAIKVYNDMKKRAQLPNVQTYTVMFRGLAKSQHPKIAVAEAVKHYNMLMNDKRLEPNSIHLNAVLNVCAKAGDLDSMFLIVNSVNEGTRSPTAYTYTTILNALRHSALKESKDLPKDQHLTNVMQTIDRSKTLWSEVVRRWKNGRLVIDEELVCAMGRVLLLHPNKTGKREVFDLIEQTMQVQNLTKTESATPTGSSSKPNLAMAKTTKGAFATPSRNALALVLTALASSQETKMGIQYWNIFTQDHGIVPDNDNWLRLLGMLKVARSSAQAATMIDMVPSDYIETTHFRIGMEACLRDNINQNVTKNANHIFDSMLERLSYPDLHTMRTFLDVALGSHYHFRKLSSSGQADKAKHDYGMQITEALARLWQPYKKSVHHFWRVVKPRDEKHAKQIYNDKREVISLARKMVSAFNKVLNENMLEDKDLAEMRPVAAEINKEIQAFYANREDIEPKLSNRKKAAAAAAAKTAQDTTAGTGSTTNVDPTEEGEPTAESILEEMEHNGGGPHLKQIRPWLTYRGANGKPANKTNHEEGSAAATA